MTKIEISGVELRLTYGMYALEKLLHYDAEKFKYPNYFLSRLIHALHENYCKGNDIDPLLTVGEIFEYLEERTGDEAFAEKLLAIANKWNESQPAKALVQANETAKKKVAELKEQALQPLEDTPSESLD